MSPLRRAINLLDRAPTRGLLGKLATWHARHRLGVDAEIFHDDCCWIHRVGTHYHVDGPRFKHYAAHVRAWPEASAKLLNDCGDYWFHHYRPAPGDTIIDVGGGIGNDALLFSEAVGPTGRVISIEAHPRTFRMLRATCRWNKLDNVTAVHRAVMDAPREVFIQDEERHEANAVSLDRREGEHLPTPVPGVRLDDLCRELNVKQAAMIKMNIEGAERFAIEGMREIAKTARYICIACHDFRDQDGGGFSTRDQVIDFLTSLGFEVSSRDEDPRPYVRDHIHGVRVGNGAERTLEASAASELPPVAGG